MRAKATSPSQSRGSKKHVSSESTQSLAVNVLRDLVDASSGDGVDIERWQLAFLERGGRLANWNLHVRPYLSPLRAIYINYGKASLVEKARQRVAVDIESSPFIEALALSQIDNAELRTRKTIEDLISWVTINLRIALEQLDRQERHPPWVPNSVRKS